MKIKLRSSLVITLTLISLALIVYWFFSPRPPEVATFIIKVAPADRILAVNGRVRPRLQVDIKSILSGKLVTLPFDVGDLVEAGQILARIDDAPEAAAIAEAEAAAQTQQAILAQARRDLARYEALGALATSQLEVEQRRLAVVEGEQELRRRRASAAQASEQRDRRILRAPFSGVILERLVDPGQTVSTESIIYRLADLSNPEITVEVDEIYATEIKPGMEALISLLGEQRQIEAVVAHIEPRVDPTTGARAVRLSLQGESINAPSGLTVTVNLVIERREQAVSIPRSAIIQSGSETSVRLVPADGVVIERRINFLDWPAREVIVTNGLKPGERVLAKPDSAQPGETVRTEN